MPSLTRINIYPIKSLGGCDVSAATVLASGALEGDRRYALVDSWGNFVNGKSCAEIHAIRAHYEMSLDSVTLSHQRMEKKFSIADEREAIAEWCSEVLEVKCRMMENTDYGFPDDSDAPGPTLVSTASLAQVADWFPGLDLPEIRRRVRANLEVDDTPPFWEDGLVTERQKIRRFRIGDVVWQGRGVCERCVVPTRDSQDGTVRQGFARVFAEQRQQCLPEWSPDERFDHFYRLGINTGIDNVEAGNAIRVGDVVELV